MDRLESERRALMRHIWAHVQKHQRERLHQSTEAPWYIEHYVDKGDELDIYGNKKLVETRITFPVRRKVADVPAWERFQRFRQASKLLYRYAVSAREKAMSYRDFNVGVSVLAFRPYVNHEHQWGVFSGMNTKHAQNMRPVCAEPIAINAAYASDFGLIAGIVVVGELREEDIGVIKTLHPCKDCRWFMQGHSIVDERTLILSAMPPEKGGFEIREVRTLGKLLGLHQRISGDNFD